MRQITEVLRLAAQGLSYRQIGQSLNVSASTIQGYVKRAERAGLSWPLPEDLDGLALEVNVSSKGHTTLFYNRGACLIVRPGLGTFRACVSKGMACETWPRSSRKCGRVGA